MRLDDKLKDILVKTIDVADHSNLARFLRHKSDWKGGRVRHSAFIPPKGCREVSTFCVDGMRDEEIWDHGDEFCKTIFRAREELKAGVPKIYDLHLSPDNDPPRHVSICGFPQDKSTLMNIAQRLASHTVLFLRSQSSFVEAQG